MVRKKIFSSAAAVAAASTKPMKCPEMEKVYKSAKESSVLSGLSGFTSNRRQYERIGSSPLRSEPKAQKPMKLGGNIAGRAYRSRASRLQCIIRVPCNIVNKMKEHYSNLKEQARSSGIRVSDLFAGNQLLMHVSAAPVRGRRKSLTPSEGFVNRVRAPVGQQREMRER